MDLWTYGPIEGEKKYPFQFVFSVSYFFFFLRLGVAGLISRKV
jgi:hypothetical protein